MRPGIYRAGDQVLIVDPTGRNQLLVACPSCDGRTGHRGRGRSTVCETCGGWGAVRSGS